MEASSKKESKNDKKKNWKLKRKKHTCKCANRFLKIYRATFFFLPSVKIRYEGMKSFRYMGEKKKMKIEKSKNENKIKLKKWTGPRDEKPWNKMLRQRRAKIRSPCGGHPPPRNFGLRGAELDGATGAQPIRRTPVRISHIQTQNAHSRTQNTYTNTSNKYNSRPLRNP